VSFPSVLDIATGVATGWRSIKVEGRNTEVGQTYVPVAPGGVYMTPQAGSAVHLRIRAGGSVSDTAAGTGAREIELYGLDANGLEVTDTIATAGESASAASSRSFMRLFRARVSKSGTYATQAAGSHADDILIESTGGTLWAKIPVNGFPEAVSRIGAFTIPADYEAYLIGVRVNADAEKRLDAILFKRENVLETSAPYAPMEIVTEFFNISGFLDVGYDAPIYLPPLTDVGMMAVIDVQTARVGSSLGLLLRRT
jgi:hypothetical protein